MTEENKEKKLSAGDVVGAVVLAVVLIISGLAVLVAIFYVGKEAGIKEGRALITAWEQEPVRAAQRRFAEEQELHRLQEPQRKLRCESAQAQSYSWSQRQYEFRNGECWTRICEDNRPCSQWGLVLGSN